MDTMRMTRRTFAKCSGALGAMAVLAACAPTQPTATPVPPTKAAPAEATKAPEPTKVPTAKPAAQGPARITFIARSNDFEMKRQDETSAAFNKKFPQYNVSNLYVSFAESEPKLMAMYAAGIPPDIYGVTGTNPYIERILRGMVLSAQPFIDKEGPDAFKDAWPVVLNVFRLSGQTWAIPPSLHVAGVWLNATLFDEAGVPYPTVDWSDKSWNWEAFVETAK
ncbi:MAG: hypothetical protein FJ026_16555, partial [Chloroflexi bacterium]|nr:hypothetical protein [Chloroflexota bacterium]